MEGGKHGPGVLVGHKGHQLGQRVFFREQDPGVHQPHLLRDLAVDAAQNVIQVRVYGVDGDVVADRPDQGALDVGSARQPLDAAKEDRVMRHDEVRARCQGLVHHRLGAVQRHQHTLHLPLRGAGDQPGVVIGFLVCGRRH